MNNLDNLVDCTLVSHAPFQAAVSEIETCFEFALEASEPICVALIGPSRTGKSRVLDACERQHPKVRLPDGMWVPILRVTAPSKPTVKSLAELLLEGLGAEDANRGTENERTRRVKTLMRNTKTRMLMIDEFQHFFDKGTRLIMHHVADWLKILVDETRCALVVAGLPSCQMVIDSNEQLAGRFHAPIEMPRFSWENLEHREEFIGILNAFHKVLSEHFQMPEFQHEAMAFRFYCATGGLIGYLTKILRRLVWQAIAARRTEITLEDLCDAHEKAVWRGRGPQCLPRPFSRSFKLIATADLLKQVSLIGSVHLISEEPGRCPNQTREIRAPVSGSRVGGRMPSGEMTKALLVRHPAPFRTESLFGYLLRLSEENGYTTPWSLFLLAEMAQHETRTTGIKVAKLAQVANRSQAELESLAYRRGVHGPVACSGICSDPTNWW